LNAGASSDESICIYNAGCITAINATAITGRYDFNSFGSDGAFTFDVDVQMPANYVVQYLLLADTAGEIQADCGVEQSLADSPYTGNQSISSLSFQPVLVELASAGFPGTVNTVATGGAVQGLGYGWMVGGGTGQQYTFSWYGRDAQATSKTTRYAFDDEVLSSVTNGVVAVRGEAVSLNSNGFTINWLEQGSASRYWGWVAIGGVTVTVGDLLSQTDSTEVSETTTGQPLAITLVSHNTNKSTQDTSQNHMSFSLGVGVSTSDRNVMGVWNENNLADTECARLIDYDAIYGRISTSEAIEGVGDLSEVSSSGFKVIWDEDPDPSQAFCAWWAVSAGASVKPWYAYAQQ
jgi:hypothetical protein